MSVREIYSIVKTPIVKLIRDDPYSFMHGDHDSTGETVDRGSGRNCFYEEGDDSSITLLPPNPMKYTSVVFHKFDIVSTFDFVDVPDIWFPGEYPYQLQQYNRRLTIPYYLKCYEAENRSKVVAISNNEDYKSYHTLKLPEHFNNTDGVKVHICENINSNKNLKIDDIVKKLFYETCYDMYVSGFKLVERDNLVAKITISDIIIDLEWIQS